MNRPLFGFRPNLQNERHRRAWEILQAVPDGQKNAFLVQAILESEEKETFETTPCGGCCGKNCKLSLPSL